MRRVKRNRLQRKLMTAVVAACFTAQLAYANPSGPAVANGQASFASQGAVLSVTHTPGAIINWQQFSIQANETTRFIQQSAASAVLNRVLGVNPSSILGTLQSNGRVFLINPNGIVFGAGSRVDVAGLVASTLNLSNEDFLAGRLNFAGDPNSAAAIINQGRLTAADGGNVYLVGAAVDNQGVITAPGGHIMLAAGKSVRVTDSVTAGLQVEITAPADGTLNLSELGNRGMYAGLIINRGVLNADSVVRGADGSITLKASNGVTLEAASRVSANGVDGGRIVIDAQQGTAAIAGSVAATGSTGRGGSVAITGNHTGIMEGARVDASGGSAGGTVLIGGADHGAAIKDGALVLANAARTAVAADAQIKADALEAGDGGHVVVWADEITRYSGSISARGANSGGEGGFVEVSGKHLEFTGSIDTRAPQGKLGTLLLDPHNITIAAGGPALVSDVNQFTDTAGTDTIIDPATLNAAAASITLQANNDITITDAISLTTSGATLSAQAGRSILIDNDITTTNAAITLTANETTANGVQDANRDAGAAAITMAAGKTINAGNANITVTLNSGAGLTNSTSGHITLENLTTSGHVLVTNAGPTAGSSILRASANSLVTAASAAFDVNSAGGGGSVGTAGNPMRVTATNLEGRAQSGGAFFSSPTQGVTIGGANLGGLTGISTTANGNISVTATGTLAVSEAVSANGSGTVAHSATGGSSDITTSAAIGSNSGLIALLADNNITLNGGGTVGASTTDGITISADNDASGAGILTTGAAIGNVSAAGTITLSAYDIALGASVTGSGAFTLKPSTASRNITIGADNSSDFSLNPLEIFYLTDGFSSITIGRISDGTGTVTVNPVTFNDPVTIVGGSIVPLRPSSRSFDGVNDRVDMGDVAGLNFERTDSFSGSAWIYVTDTTVLANSIVSKGDANSPYPGWAFQAFRRATEDSTALTLFLINDALSGNLLEVNSGANTIAANTWYHVAFTYDGSSSASGIKLFINGALQTNTVIADSLSGTIQQSMPVVIGDRGNSGGFQPFKGQIADVQLFNRTLSGGEIGQIKTNPGAVTSGLQGYWALAGTSPEPDYSGTNHGGTVVGASNSANAPLVTILNTGTNALTLIARTGDIQGSGAGTDINAGSLSATAVTGVGNITQLVTSGLTSGNASTSGAGAAAISIANSSASATTVSSLVTVGANAPITFAQSGGGALTIASAATADGAINFSSDSADLIAASLSAGGSNNTVALTTTTSGNVVLSAINAAIKGLTVTSAGTVSLPSVTTRNGGITVSGTTITLNGDLSTNATATAGAISLSGAVTLGTNVTVTTDAATTDADISLARVDGAHALTLNAGSGNIIVQAASRIFDGVDDEITTTTNFGANPFNGTLSLSAWIKTTSTAGHIVVGIDDNQIGQASTAHDRALYVDTSGNAVFGVYSGGTVLAKSTNPVNDGAWHHLVGISTNGVDIKLYVDGTLQQTTAVGALYNAYSASYLRIGGYALAGWTGGNSGYFDGSIADVQLYNRALLPSEVSQIKIAPGAVTSGLQGYWPMWMGGVKEADRSGQANNGTVTGTSAGSGPTPLSSAGGITALSSLSATGNAITMNGITTTGSQGYTGSVTLNGPLTTTSNGNIGIATPSSLLVTQPISADGSGTVMLTATGVASNITTSAAIGSGSGLISLLADNNITLSTGGTVGANTIAAITISADNDGSGAGMLTTGAAIGNASAAGAITLNGHDMALGASVTGSGTLTIAPSTASRNITIGADNTSDFALNPLEIFNLTDGFSSITIGRIADGTGTVTVNPVTFNDALTIAGGTITFGRPLSRNFDGVDDYIVSSANITLGNTFTIAAWVNSAVGTQNAYGRIAETLNNNGFYLGTDGTGTKYQWIVNDNSAPFGSVISSALTAGVWTFVTGTYDGTTGILYVNGINAGSNTFSAPGTVARPVYLGTYSGAPGYNWSGGIADVSVYNRALSGPEVGQIKTSPGSITSGLVMYWPLSGASPEADFSGSNNSGVLNNGVTTSASTPPVTILNTGTNALTLTARIGSIQGSGGGTDINANALTATAVTGIGSTTQLVTSGLTSASVATSGAGAAAINIANSSASPTTLNSVATIGANAPITFAQSGGGALTSTSAATTDGAVTLSNSGANLVATTVTAGGSGRNITLTTTTSGTLNAGNLTAVGDTISLNSAGSIVDSGVLSARLISGQAVNDITLNGTLSASGSGDSLVLAAGGNFINNAGAGVLNAGTGRWLVYSTSPAGSTENGLTGAAGSALPRLYNRTYAGNPPASIAEPGNHLIYSSAPGLTVTPDGKSKVYGADDPAQTYAAVGYVSDDGVTDTAGTAGLSGAFTRVAGESVGTRAITQGTFDSNGSYSITFTAGSTLAITPAALSGTIASQSKVYGADDPALAGIAVALGSAVNRTVTTWNGNVAVDDTGNVSTSLASLTRTAGETVAGSPYSITAGTLNALSGSAAGNYSASLNTAGNTLTITPRMVSVTADAQTKIYGDSDPVLSFTASNLANNPGIGVVDTVSTAFTGALNRTAGESVSSGPYTINQNTLAANANYTLTSYTGNTLAITPSGLTIRADDTSRVQDTANPPLTASYSGFKFSETSAVLGGMLSLTTPAILSSPVGLYAITPSGQTASNYALLYIDGVLSVGSTPIGGVPPLVAGPVVPQLSVSSMDRLTAEVLVGMRRLGAADALGIGDINEQALNCAAEGNPANRGLKAVAALTPHGCGPAGAAQVTEDTPPTP